MSDVLQERYAAIERDYSQGLWQQVLSGSAALLAELPDQPGDPLRTRLTLLQGHTLLYGLGQISEAAAIYRQVIDSQPEPVLQSIATQELERCLTQAKAEVEAQAAAAPTPDPASAGTAFPFSAAPIAGATSPQQTSAMPWLEAMGGVDPAANLLPVAATAQPPWMQTQAVPAAAAPSEAIADVAIADVIDEPEQIEVHQADPARAEVVDLALDPQPLEATLETLPAPETQPATDAEPFAEPLDEPTGVSVSPERWSSAEEAELARGILTVVLR